MSRLRFEEASPPVLLPFALTVFANSRFNRLLLSALFLDRSSGSRNGEGGNLL